MNLFAANELLKNCWHYFVLGVIQGITEFLPISSTAHLKVMPILLGWPDPGLSVSAALQLGSIASVIMYFRHDLKKVIQGIHKAILLREWNGTDARLGLALLTGTIPILLAGIGIKLLWTNFEISIFRSFPSIGLISICMAMLLLYAEKIGSLKKSISSITSKDGLWIGIGQMLAIIPGTSRSGITLTASLICGFNRKDAAKLSFLLGIPAISIAGLVELKDAFSQDLSGSIFPMLIGIITSAIMSWITIDWLMKFLQRNTTEFFIIYRLVFGIALIYYWLQLKYNLL